MRDIPELYPKRASPRLPKPHVAKSKLLPLIGYRAVIFFGLIDFSSHDCSLLTCAAIEAARSWSEALCSAADGLRVVILVIPRWIEVLGWRSDTTLCDGSCHSYTPHAPGRTPGKSTGTIPEKRGPHTVCWSCLHCELLHEPSVLATECRV